MLIYKNANAIFYILPSQKIYAIGKILDRHVLVPSFIAKEMHQKGACKLRMNKVK